MAKVSFLNGEYVITVEKWPYILIIFGITVFIYASAPRDSCAPVADDNNEAPAWVRCHASHNTNTA